MNLPRWTKQTREKAEQTYELSEAALAVFRTAAKDRYIDPSEQRLIEAAMHDQRAKAFETRYAARCAETGQAAGDAMVRCRNERHATGLIGVFLAAVGSPASIDDAELEAA